MLPILEQIGQEILQAVAADLEAMESNEQLYRDASYAASKALGIDVTGGFVKPYWDKAYHQGIEAMKSMVKTAEPYPEEAADLIKEKSASFADSFAEALKKRTAQKKIEEANV